MQESLDYLKKVIEPVDAVSIIELIANRDKFAHLSEKLEVKVSEIAQVSRSLGEELGRTEKISASTVDQLTDILTEVQNLAMSEQLHKEQESSNLGSTFYTNALNLLVEIVLKPLADAIFGSDINTNYRDFQDLCLKCIQYFEALVDPESKPDLEHYKNSSSRMMEIYQKVFVKEKFPPEFSSN